VSGYPEKLDNQLTISPSNASQDSVGMCVAQVSGHGCLRAFDGDYGLGAMADEWVQEGSVPEQETWIFRAELRDADVRRDVGRYGCGSRSGRGSLRGVNAGGGKDIGKVIFS
jgi:hypothetical protein